MNDRVQVVVRCVFLQEMGEVGGFLPRQIVEEIEHVVRQDRCSEHTVTQTVEQNVEVGRLIVKENFQVEFGCSPVIQIWDLSLLW